LPASQLDNSIAGRLLRVYVVCVDKYTKLIVGAIIAVVAVVVVVEARHHLALLAVMAVMGASAVVMVRLRGR
jgi:hypothetical protein